MAKEKTEPAGKAPETGMNSAERSKRFGCSLSSISQLREPLFTHSDKMGDLVHERYLYLVLQLFDGAAHLLEGPRNRNMVSGNRGGAETDLSISGTP